MAKPVTILTGFLGSGKTTLFNALMAARPATRYALIENEFGEEGIDGALILRPDVDIVEMSNGCLCCSLNDGLLDVLEALDDRREGFDELIIETTGIADPANIAVPFLMLPMVQRAFTLKRVICLVDAELIEDQLRDTEEAIQQISFSDAILINKTDRVSAQYIATLRETLQSLNPLARVLIGYKETYPVEDLLAIDRDTAAAVRPATFVPTAYRPVSGVAPIHPKPEIGREQSGGPLPHKHHHHLHSDIVSLSFRFAEPFDVVGLHHRLITLLLFQGQGIYRIKGIIADAQRSQRMIVQSVGKTMTIAEGADWQPGEERISRIVIIGKLLKPAGFEKLLQHCLVKEPQWTMTSSSQLLKSPPL